MYKVWKDTEDDDNVSLQDKLTLWRAMDVGNTSWLAAMDKGWAAYMIPHLTWHHSKAEELKQNIDFFKSKFFNKVLT